MKYKNIFSSNQALKTCVILYEVRNLRFKVTLYRLLIMNSLIDLLNISVDMAIKFELEVNYSRGTSCSDGEFGREHDINPKADQWFSADYRYGFITAQVI